MARAICDMLVKPVMSGLGASFGTPRVAAAGFIRTSGIELCRESNSLVRSRADDPVRTKL
jgi:hypothetical protein